MKIRKYNLELDKNKHPFLVKECETNYNVDILNTPLLIADMANSLYRLDKQAEEYCYLIALNTKCRVLGTFELAHGNDKSSITDCKGIFSRILLTDANSFALIHNHPSGDATPSKDDFYITEKIKKSSEIMNIDFLDHIIIGDQFYSMRETCFLQGKQI